MIRELFCVPYRQTEGFGRALAKLMNAGVAIPHHTSLVKRAAKLSVSIHIDPSKGPIDVVVDSTGLKVYGEGEWKVRQHGADKRREWRKVHLAVDPDSHAIVAQMLTDSSVHDGDAVKPLLEQVEQDVNTFYGDGAYDQWKVRDHLQSEKIDQVIPPRRNAPFDHPNGQQHGNSSEDPLERARVPAADPARRPRGVEGGSRLSPPQLGGDRHEPDERRLRRPPEEPLGAQPGHRSRPPLQDTQRLRLSWHAN
jgi:hypothetical protein